MIPWLNDDFVDLSRGIFSTRASLGVECSGVEGGGEGFCCIDLSSVPRRFGSSFLLFAAVGRSSPFFCIVDHAFF